MVVELPAPWVDHVDAVPAAFAALDVADEVGAPGCGPVAFGALPFDRDAPARLVVPARLEGSTPDGDRWVTEIGDGPGPADGTIPEPTHLEVCAPVATDAWCGAVAAATARIVDGALTKVVLARELVVSSDTVLDPRRIATRLEAAHPAALRFLVDGFCGASPELLVSRVGDVVRAHPMAGTTPRSGDPARDARQAADLLASSKNRVEHQITIDEVHETLLPWCSYLDAEPEPSVVAAGSVQHLATMVEGRLSDPAPSVLELVAALHPTPAVGGWPRLDALALIDELEPGDRGRYAGPVGWVDAAGNGSWAVGIRSVSMRERTARLWAGVGVVADSDPVAELEETRAKFAATLQHLLRL
jgi:menaquinone-specific isochorismate synthase